jgi:phosphoribosylanthranilate isomerase
MATEVKICGITRLEDALAAVASGADAIGFIFHRPSPRYVTPESVTGIINCIPSEVTTVGVFVNADAAEVIDIMTRCRLDMIQFHGTESPEYCRQFPPSRVVKAVSPGSDYIPADLDRYDVRAFLVDTYAPEQHGGTGRRANWQAAATLARSHPLILAGGLTAENLAEAIASVSPDAVDINSGVELAPGRKDGRKIEHCMREVRKHGIAPSRNIFCKHTKKDRGHDEATLTG